MYDTIEALKQRSFPCSLWGMLYKHHRGVASSWSVGINHVSKRISIKHSQTEHSGSSLEGFVASNKFRLLAGQKLERFGSFLLLKINLALSVY